jgi:hypothetical protein
MKSPNAKKRIILALAIAVALLTALFTILQMNDRAGPESDGFASAGADEAGRTGLVVEDVVTVDVAIPDAAAEGASTAAAEAAVEAAEDAAAEDAAETP